MTGRHGRTLLFVGDGCVSTGFAQATHNYLDVLSETWDVHLLALNYKGDTALAKKYTGDKYEVSTCWTHQRGDGAGYQRLPELVGQYLPDVVVVQNDPWNFQNYIRQSGNVPVVGIVAVDALNCLGGELNGLKHAIFWTEFGETQAKLGGYRGSSSVIPLGVDTDLFRPMDRADCRRRIGWPERLKDAFIVGVAGRNHKRKRFDLAALYFAEWVKTHDVRDAYLAFHTAPTGDVGTDVSQLMSWCGLANKLFIPPTELGQGMPREKMPVIYNAWDMQLSLANEGMGLHQLEGMACGVALAATDFAALGEWPRGAADLIPVSHYECAMPVVNTVVGVSGRADTVAALEHLYRDRGHREAVAAAGLARARERRFSWRAIGEQVRDAVEAAVRPAPKAAPQPAGQEVGS